MATALRQLLRTSSRSTEPHDVYAAFLRLAKARWGERVSLEPRRFAAGVLTVSCSSPLWKAELLSHTEELRSALQEALPTARLNRIRAVLS